MPYKFETDKIRLPKDKDRRRKLTEADKIDIKRLYVNGLEIRKIARIYGHLCSRRLIQFVLFPQRAKTVAEHYKNRGQANTTYQRVQGKEPRIYASY